MGEHMGDLRLFQDTLKDLFAKTEIVSPHVGMSGRAAAISYISNWGKARNNPSLKTETLNQLKAGLNELKCGPELKEITITTKNRETTRQILVFSLPKDRQYDAPVGQIKKFAEQSRDPNQEIYAVWIDKREGLSHLAEIFQYAREKYGIGQVQIAQSEAYQEKVLVLMRQPAAPQRP